MIWESVVAMTSIDIFIVSTSVVCSVILFRNSKYVQKLGFMGSAILIVSGLIIFSSLYFIDFIAMHILPQFVGREVSMAFMKDLHLNWSWIISFTGISMLILGTAMLVRKLIPGTVTTLENLERTKEELAESVENYKQLQDILSEHKKNLEIIVAQRTKELKVSNEELESYSYSIAHDLRTPLRAITSYSQIVLDDAREKLTDSERENLSRVVSAGKNMAKLIDDILNIAKVSRADIKKDLISLSEIANRICNELSHLHPERQVSFFIAEGLVTEADEDLLTLVLSNLINNAWKYSENIEHAQIKFAAKIEKNEVIYYVSDNGIGFNMEYVNKIFQPFERLHRINEYPGSGIGLAAAKRIVERHGGRIWAKSTEGKGATFYFTLSPAALEHIRENNNLNVKNKKQLRDVATIA